MAATIAERHSLHEGLGSPPINPQPSSNHRASPSIVIDHDTASSSFGSHSSTPTEASFSSDQTHTGAILDRRKSGTGPSPRTSLTRQRSVGAGSRSLKRISRSGKPGFGPLLPVLVPMADSQDESAVSDGARTPGSASQTFEEAPESAPSPPNEVSQKSADGLGITGNGGTDAPLRLSPRLSQVVDPDDMMFAGDGAEEEQSESNHTRQHSRQKTLETAPQLLARPLSVRSVSRERSASPSKPTPVLSGDLPLLSPPLSVNEDRPTSASPPGMARKASSGFAGLLGRMGSIRRPAKSPPPPRQDGMFSRRDTAASIDSAAGGTLASIADGVEDGNGKASRPSLQDQFQSLRKQEEYGIPGANGHYIQPEEGKVLSPPRRSSNASTTGPPSPLRTRPDSSSSIKSPPMNPDLPPGTASGMTAGPAEQPRPVDWDMWQALVMEGPGAVTKSSGQELSQAIASGIPAAIRGVVWQILAESKNEELESLYHTLKFKGITDSETSSRRPTPKSRNDSQSNISVASESTDVKEGSQANSELHSESSTPPATNLASPPASLHGEEHELKTKLLLEKQKREAAALQKLERAIKRDMGSRTSYSKFTQSAGLQDGLFGVCKAYALFDEGVGYAQGINFIAMPLLFNMSEGEAFALLVRLMSKYDVRSLFVGDLAGLHLRLFQFERLLEDHDPALYCHLKRRSVSPQLYATQWFLTMFAYRFPLQLVLRVYDLVFSEGITAILKFGIVLLQRNRNALLEMKDMGQLTNFLKEKVFDVYIDKSPSASSLLDSGFFGSVTGGADKELYRADEMVRDACEIRISETVLAAYSLEWDELQRVTHERDSELEHLRTSNISLTARVKALEERTQQADSEHVQIAGDLVRVKVENDALHDEVEGLKIRNEELQKLVDAQPAEVEARLQEEMERIMQRNSEVQNENRSLKEEMDETERALVEAKMQHAQTLSEHDTLKQRMNSIQAMFNDK